MVHITESYNKIYIHVHGLSKNKLNFFLKHLLISLQLKTCHIQSSPLHCLYTASNVYSSSRMCLCDSMQVS
jgi:hypothetical protein